MADSTVVLDAKRDKASMETAMSDWQTANNPTSIDDVSVANNGQNRVLITIAFTA